MGVLPIWRIDYVAPSALAGVGPLGWLEKRYPLNYYGLAHWKQFQVQKFLVLMGILLFKLTKYCTLWITRGWLMSIILVQIPLFLTGGCLIKETHKYLILCYAGIVSINRFLYTNSSALAGAVPINRFLNLNSSALVGAVPYNNLFNKNSSAQAGVGSWWQFQVQIPRFNGGFA